MNEIDQTSSCPQQMISISDGFILYSYVMIHIMFKPMTNWFELFVRQACLVVSGMPTHQKLLNN